MIRWSGRRTLAAILPIVAAGMLQGCVYDPSIRAYVPCCAAYPAYGGYYGYPAYGAGVPAFAGVYGGPGVVQGGWGPGVTQANWMGANDGGNGHR
jgi:hypothetical protein